MIPAESSAMFAGSSAGARTLPSDAPATIRMFFRLCAENGWLRFRPTGIVAVDDQVRNGGVA